MQIALKFKPRTTCIDNSGVIASAGASPTSFTAPRLFLTTNHDVDELAIVPTSKNDILKQENHTIYDLSTQRMYHLKPSTSVLVENAAGGSSSNQIQWNQWQSNAVTGGATAQTLFQGLQCWMEWYTPIPAVVIDIYATYTVSMRKLQE